MNTQQTPAHGVIGAGNITAFDVPPDWRYKGER